MKVYHLEIFTPLFFENAMLDFQLKKKYLACEETEHCLYMQKGKKQILIDG